jgi:hypothetical protein
MTRRQAEHWPTPPDEEPDYGVRYELERTTTAFLTLLWRQRQIAEKETAKT